MSGRESDKVSRSSARIDFDKYFAVEYEKDGSRVYRILPAAP